MITARARTSGPLVIRTPRPAGAIDICQVADRERAERRRRARETAWRLSWRGRLEAARNALRRLV